MPINPQQHKEREEVELSEETKFVAICRCWRSKKMPLCDGSHRKCNEETGEKTGPCIVKRK